jgi:carbamoyl-phosphate synthase small subunit
MQKKQIANLILEDSSQFKGYLFGSQKNVTGEIIVNTSMNGYPESMTDPAINNQILLFSYPLIGNIGVPSIEMTDIGISKYLESNSIQPSAIIISDAPDVFSH